MKKNQASKKSSPVTPSAELENELQFDLSFKNFDEVENEALAVFVYEGELPLKGIMQELDQKVGGAISGALQSKEIKGKLFENTFVSSPSNLRVKRLFIFGAGKKEQFNEARLRQLSGAIARTMRSRGVNAYALMKRGQLDSVGATQAVVEGTLLGLFEADKYKTEGKNEKKIRAVTLLGGDASRKKPMLQAIDRARIVADAQNFARELINEPSNRMTPTLFARAAEQVAKDSGLEIQILERKDAEKLGMGAFLSVARGSDEPPKIVVLRYNPPAPTPDAKVIGLVGKGITFDTGGISLKQADGMEKMKYDMAGGAIVLGAMRAIAQLMPKVRALAVIPTTENMPSGKSQKPGDVQTSMSGKTIEVINTDAEGRLVLADGLAYAKQLGATHLVDVATLTGSIAVALGYFRVGAMGNNQKWLDAVLRSADESGEKFWPMPLDAEYRELLKSHIADLANVGPRYGGAITAAKFLEEFVGDTPWVHLDIAGTAWIDEAKPHLTAGATGVALRTLVHLICSQR